MRISRRLFVATGLTVAGVTKLAPASLAQSESTFDLTGVSEFELLGAGTVEVRIGDTPLVSISAPDEVLESIDVVIDEEGGASIGPPEDDNVVSLPGDSVHYDITVTSLESASFDGSLDITIEQIQGDELRLRLSGASTAEANDISVSDLEIELDGSASLTIAGSAAEADIELRGASTLSAESLTISAADIRTRDSASAAINVTNSLVGRAEDASTIGYIGSPAELETDIRDAAAISQSTGATPVAATPGATPGALVPIGPADHSVSIQDRLYVPANIEVSIGDTVIWTNNDDTSHTVTQTPLGEGFRSEIMAEGAVFEVTFDTPGEYPYFCEIHPDMTGSVNVT